MVNVQLFDDFDAVAGDSGGRLDREARATPFERLDWFRLIAEHCPPPGRPLVLRGRAGNRSGWLFLAIEHPRAEALTAWYSLRFDAVASRDEDVITALAAALRDGGVAEVTMAPIEDPEPLRRGFEAAGWSVTTAAKTVSWRIDTDGMDFEDYWAQRPARLRNTAKRRAKAAAVDIEIHTRFDPAAWADYESVYRASWKPEEGSFPFLRAFAEQEGAAGSLRLGIARHDRRPVAAQLWTVDQGTAWIHKLAYAEEAKALSPGTLLSMAMFRHALDEDRVKAIDYGTGDEPYKADWMAERRPLWQLTAYNPRTLKGLAGTARAFASRLVGRGGSR